MTETVTKWDGRLHPNWEGEHVQQVYGDLLQAWGKLSNAWQHAYDGGDIDLAEYLTELRRPISRATHLIAQKLHIELRLS